MRPLYPGLLSNPARLVYLLTYNRFCSSCPSALKNLNGLHAILDNDAFTESRMKYDGARLKSELFMLHDEIEKVFKLTVTSHAVKKWK